MQMGNEQNIIVIQCGQKQIVLQPRIATILMLYMYVYTTVNVGLFT